MPTLTSTESGSDAAPGTWIATWGFPIALFAGAAAALILSASFWLQGAPGIFNADGLLSVAFVHDLQYHFATIGQFQLPRIPSLFPDLAVYTLLASFVADYRIALFGSSVVQVAAFLILASFVMARATGRPVVVSALSLCLVTAAAIGLNAWAGGIQYFNRMFATFEHFGPFCLSLVSLLIVLHLLVQQSRALWMLLGLIETLAIASNKGYAIVFVGPCLAALLLEWRSHRLASAIVLRFAACTTIAGMMATLILEGFELQPAPDVNMVLTRAGKFAADLARLFGEWPLTLTVLLLAPLAHLLLFRRLWPALLRLQSMRMVWTIACLATGGAAALCAVLYDDYGSLRYLTAAIFWPLVFLAASLAVWASVSLHRLLALIAVTGLYFSVLTYSSISATGSFRGWHLPLADCLMENREKLGLKDGLAYYWLARPTVISSGWMLQIEQMQGGRNYHWGNNPYWATHSVFDESRPPHFNYILPGTQNPADVLRNFGPPSRVEQCIGNEIWIYDEGISELK